MADPIPDPTTPAAAQALRRFLTVGAEVSLTTVQTLGPNAVTVTTGRPAETGFAIATSALVERLDQDHTLRAHLALAVLPPLPKTQLLEIYVNPPSQGTYGTDDPAFVHAGAFFGIARPTFDIRLDISTAARRNEKARPSLTVAFTLAPFAGRKPDVEELRLRVSLLLAHSIVKAG